MIHFQINMFMVNPFFIMSATLASSYLCLMIFRAYPQQVLNFEKALSLISEGEMMFSL